MTAERRISNRLRLRDDSFVVLRFERPVIGKINDISKHGASILYFQSNGFSEEQPLIDIFTSDNSFVLQHIPFRTITDSQVDMQLDLGKTTLRKKGVMFDNLNASKKTELKYFIRAYAANPSSNVADINSFQDIPKTMPDSVKTSPRIYDATLSL